MNDSYLLHELIETSSYRHAGRPAVTFGDETVTYGALSDGVAALATGLLELGLARSERVGIYLDKRPEIVIAAFGAAAAGGVFVPINPLLKPGQVTYILRDCNVRVLVTSAERLGLLEATLGECPDLRHVVITGSASVSAAFKSPVHEWRDVLAGQRRTGHRVIDTDMAAIRYTSGSTGNPKGVVLSHRNMVAGAKSVASYLENTADDTLLAALPLSFDAEKTSERFKPLPGRERGLVQPEIAVFSGDTVRMDEE